MYVRCCFFVCFFFFKQKTAYEMRISDWSSDVCSSDLSRRGHGEERAARAQDCRAPAVRSSLRRHHRRDHRRQPQPQAGTDRRSTATAGRSADRKSVVWGKSVSVRVELGGRRIIKKKTKTKQRHTYIKTQQRAGK